MKYVLKCKEETIGPKSCNGSDTTPTTTNKTKRQLNFSQRFLGENFPLRKSAIFSHVMIKKNEKIKLQSFREKPFDEGSLEKSSPP